MSELNFQELFLDRRSIRSYDPTVKISKAELSEILAAATRAPSSQNMQPWHFVVVASPEGKEKIKPAMMFNSLQAETSSAMIFIFGDLDPASRVEQIMQGPVDLGTMTPENRDQRVEQISDYYNRISLEAIKQTATLDVGLVAMSLMITAREYGYDTCPIGGYDKETINELLGLDQERYFPIVALSLGKAVDEGYTSCRLPINELVNWQ